MADMRTQLWHLPGQVCVRVCVYVRVVLCAREFLRASEIILVKEGLSVSVGVYGGVCRYNFTVAEESL